MEKVFDLHVHYKFEIPLPEMVSIFKEEFAATGTEKKCFLSLPYDEKAQFREMQNMKGLYLKWAFSPDAYAFAALEHPSDHSDVEAVAEFFLSQAKRYLSVGYDGIKMLDGYPSLVKIWGLPVDNPVYDRFYAFMEENGYPVLMHIANPSRNWDITKATEYDIQMGRVYDDSYPSKDELTAQAFRVMEKFPKLRLILAHFGFMSDNIAAAERFFSYPNTLVDITPGGEQLIYMQKEWDKWLPFWTKYQDRIFYGTDYYAFPKDENWEVSFQRRPTFLRQFLETDGQYLYSDEPFGGVNLPKPMRDKIYRENFMRLLGSPKPIDCSYLRNEAVRLQSVEGKSSPIADEDLAYILSQIP